MGQKRKKVVDLDSDLGSETGVGTRESRRSSEKRIKVESSTSQTPQPLTRENLILLQAKMAPPKSTGSRNHGQNHAGTGHSTHNSTIPGDVSDRTTGSTKTKLTNTKETRKLLKLNNLLVDVDVDSLSTRGKAIVDRGKELIKGTRLSPEDKERTKLFGKRRAERQFSPENTFLNVIWDILVSPQRTVKETTEDHGEEVDHVLVKQWDLDGLIYNLNAQFQPGSVPLVDTRDDPLQEALLEKLPGVKNPVPDLVCGLSEGSFTPEEDAANTRLNKIAELSDDLYHPFFVVEFKSHKGHLPDAVNQACRGGAAMIQAIASVEEEAKYVCKEIYDDVSYAFSLALNPDGAEMYVHFKEPTPRGKLIYYMQLLNGYSLKVPEHVENLRTAINNVLDWGVLNRRAHVNRLLNAIAKRLLKTHLNTKQPAARSSVQGLAQGSAKASTNRVTFAEGSNSAKGKLRVSGNGNGRHIAQGESSGDPTGDESDEVDNDDKTDLDYKPRR